MSANCPRPPDPAKVSIHGGHSGEFCAHAKDRLEEILLAYREAGFSWVGITEHMPPTRDEFRYADEIELGVDSRYLYERFASYIDTCRSLQKKYRRHLHIAVGFETETYRGSAAFIRQLISEFTPDYIVGSVHHVDDINFDFSESRYQQAAAMLGGIDRLYERYFDIQHDMIRALRPAVVGHFDLIRIFDPDYRNRLKTPSIQQKILRNLKLIRDLDLILDLNVRALQKGADEPYISRSILVEARNLEIAVVPGDDSHGLTTVGSGIPEGIALLAAMGFDTRWRLPGETARHGD